MSDQQYEPSFFREKVAKHLTIRRSCEPSNKISEMSEKIWVFPKIVVLPNPNNVNFNRVFHYKPSILGVKSPYFWVDTHIDDTGGRSRRMCPSVHPQFSQRILASNEALTFCCSFSARFRAKFGVKIRWLTVFLDIFKFENHPTCYLLKEFHFMFCFSKSLVNFFLGNLLQLETSRT